MGRTKGLLGIDFLQRHTRGIPSLKQNRITNGIFFDAKHVLFEGVLCVKSITRFERTWLNIILFTSTEIVQNSLHSFSRTHKRSASLHACLSSVPKFARIGEYMCKARLEVYLRPKAKCDFHCAECHETRNNETRFCEHLTHRVLWRSNEERRK